MGINVKTKARLDVEVHGRNARSYERKTNIGRASLILDNPDQIIMVDTEAGSGKKAVTHCKTQITVRNGNTAYQIDFVMLIEALKMYNKH